MITRTRAAAWLVALASLGALPASARDQWDASLKGDGGIFTDNALFHGSEQAHDLEPFIPTAPPDQDWYIAVTRPFSSYEVLVYGLTGDLDLVTSDVQRMSTDGTQALQNALITDAGGVLSLQWQQGAAAGAATQFIRVHDPACGTCGAFASYRIRSYESTCTVPRVNNSGTQTTVLLVQNATDRPCSVTYHYFDTSGGIVASAPPVTLAPYGQDVVATAATVPGLSGSARITHDCGYGGLSGKAVALESSTGFTFDTPFVSRPH